MAKMTIRLRLCLLLMAAPLSAMAQNEGQKTDLLTADSIHTNDKDITNAIMVGIGATQILDTYLSPEKYRGTEVRYLSHTTRERRSSRWSRQIVHQGDIAYTENRSGDGNEVAGMYGFQYAWHYNWRMAEGRLNIKAGAMVDATVGFVYNTRNGNNPAQARAALNVSPSAVAAYRFRLWNRPFLARYEVSAPLAGLMFSPNYGQSYYEIFTRGNYDHNIVPTTLAATPSLRQMLTIDFTLGRTTLRVGYLGDMQQAKVNNLKSHTYTHAFVIGIVRTFRIFKIKY